MQILSNVAARAALLTFTQATLFLISGCGAGRYQTNKAAPPGPPQMSMEAAAAMEPQAPRAELAESEESDASNESYDTIRENRYQSPTSAPLSTFAIDVDTASYSNMRRFLRQGTLPPANAVRIEEMINYFDYDYPQPTSAAPFAVITEVGPAPWRPDHRLVHIGLQAKSVAPSAVPPRNLVFLLDVSGSMQDPNKLPLLKEALSLLVSQLNARDRVAIVVYAGASGAVLQPTPGSDKERILQALRSLQAEGSTNGSAGIELAYALAEKSFVPGAINRVILATDGDFNVGITDRNALMRLIEEKRKSGVYLTVLGFGMGNLKDGTMETLADKGNGNYAYIDTLEEARKVLVTEAASTLLTVAKDVKVQVAFNPDQIASYRLIGYENRLLSDRDFADDSKDAGDIGAGHTVTALYEIELKEKPALSGANAGAGTALVPANRQSPLMTVKLRHKAPGRETSTAMETVVHDADRPLAATSASFRFSAAVAGFGMLLRGSEHKGAASFAQMRALAAGALGADPHGYRRELIELIDAAARIAGEPSKPGLSRAR